MAKGGCRMTECSARTRQPTCLSAGPTWIHRSTPHSALGRSPHPWSAHYAMSWTTELMTAPCSGIPIPWQRPQPILPRICLVGNLSARKSTCTWICLSWNSGHCMLPGTCEFSHECHTCHEDHMAKDCSLTPADSMFRRPKRS